MRRISFFLATLTASLALLAEANSDQNTEALKTQIDEVSDEFIAKLSSALKNALKADGPVSAIEVCKTVAPSLTNTLSGREGWNISRVSLRIRNPMIGSPDVWEQAQLIRFDEMSAEDVAGPIAAVSEIIEEPQGRYLRYIRPLKVQRVCLTCHGTKDDIPEQVATKLVELYPHDRATGYTIGQNRGALSIKVLLED
jgi:hypothetical protein